MIEIRLACGCVGLIIILNALFDAIEKRRNSYLYKSFSLKKSPNRFILMLVVDFVIGAAICYRSYLGTFALGSTVALIFAYNSLSVSFIYCFDKMNDKEDDDDDDDDDRNSIIGLLVVAAIFGAFIVYSAITTGIAFSDFGNFIADFFDD